MQEENNRVQQLSQMIDQMVAKTVVDTCKEKKCMMQFFLW